MAKENLKKFRHDIAVLKNKGLISGIDARSITPTTKLKKLIDRFDDVLSSKATPVKLSKTETKNLKDAGYDTYKGRVIFPHSAGEKVGVSHGHAKRRQPNGVEVVTVPVEYHKLEQYFDDLSKNKKFVDSMKKKDEYFAFRFHGHQSHAVFRSIDLLQERFREYKAVDNARRSKSAKKMAEVYRNLEIVKVHRSRDWAASGEAAKQKWAKSKKKQKRKSPKRTPLETAEYRRKDAAKKKEYRQRIKSSPSKDTAYKKAAKKRAKKSRRNHAKKNRHS